MGSLSQARFSLRHPEDGPQNSLDTKVKVAAREEYAAECASRVVSTRAASSRKRSSPAFAADARNPSFYSPLAREIAAISDPEERSARIRSLGFFALPVHVEVDLLRMCMRLGVDVGPPPTADAPISKAPTFEVGDIASSSPSSTDAASSSSRSTDAASSSSRSTDAESDSSPFVVVDRPTAHPVSIASDIDSSLQALMPPPVPDDDDTEDTEPAPIAFLS